MSSASVAVGGSSPLTRGKRSGGRGPRSGGPAHPRSRGENFPIWFRAVSGRGSSPLTRGKRSGGRGPRSGGPAHPRSRGENFPVWFRAVSGRGSSPLTRGKHQARSRGLDAGGLIPAHAGKTRWCNFGGSCTWAHPRSRGENDGAFNWRANFPGSSPLTRGKPECVADELFSVGLIPAHAGKTRRWCWCRSCRRAHPRSRGENEMNSTTSPGRIGSSPLTRGKLTACDLRHI